MIEESSTPDLAEFYAAIRKQGPVCTVAVLLDGLPEERAAAFRAVLAKPKTEVPHRAISDVVNRWLTERPVGSLDRVAPETVSRHRMLRCSCPR